jgi:hypothetical protein
MPQHTEIWYRWMPIPFGLVIAAGFAVAAFISRLVRFYFYTVLAIVGGVVFPFLPLTGNLSSHLSKLEAAGYVEIQKEFVDKIPRALLSLTPQGREAFQAYQQNMMHVFKNLPG